jgi:lipopolysaccharide biosynthesis glycosyltransferase
MSAAASVSRGQPIAVVLAADSVFSKQLAVVIASISESANRDYRVFVLHDGYEPSLMKQISGVAGEAVTLCWLDARSLCLEDAHLPASLPTAALFRLRIGDLLPDDIERVIYIDTDTAVRRPLDELWEANLDGCVLGAVRDPVVPWAAAPKGLPWSVVGVPPETPYFNSGVLVVDMRPWRSQRISEHALGLLAQHRFLYGDQCALNTVLLGRWAPIGPQWNIQAGHLAGDGSLAWVTESRDSLAAAIDDPAIIHFNKSALRRPWDSQCTHPYRDLWLEYLDRTPWKGWRPPAKPSHARNFAKRVRKAGTILIRG